MDFEILIKIPNGQINHIPAMVQIMLDTHTQHAYTHSRRLRLLQVIYLLI